MTIPAFVARRDPDVYPGDPAQIAIDLRTAANAIALVREEFDSVIPAGARFAMLSRALDALPDLLPLAERLERALARFSAE